MREENACPHLLHLAASSARATSLEKADPNLRGPLKDMQKLSKREPEQRHDDRYGVSE
jgi:hypothetical protein